jgi:hypothetical protein
MIEDLHDPVVVADDPGMCACPGCRADVTHVHTTWVAAREPWADYFCPGHCPPDSVPIPDALAGAGTDWVGTTGARGRVQTWPAGPPA